MAPGETARRKRADGGEITETARGVLDAAGLLVTSGVLSHSGHANLTGRAGEGRCVLTAAGVIRNLSAGQLAVAGIDGSVIEGELSRRTPRSSP